MDTTIQQKLDELEAHLNKIESALKNVYDVLELCEEYFDQRADAETVEGQWEGNEEMRMLVRIREVLGA
jgi:hypothetical protein